MARERRVEMACMLHQTVWVCDSDGLMLRRTTCSAVLLSLELARGPSRIRARDPASTEELALLGVLNKVYPRGLGGSLYWELDWVLCILA
jgi:hypothetical protein